MATPAFVDGLERALWTAAEAAGAVGLVAGWQALPLPDIPAGYLPLAVVVIGALLAGGKSWAATRWGNGTAATLPARLEPTPPEQTSLAEEGRQLASEREDLIAQGVDPAALDTPLHPSSRPADTTDPSPTAGDDG